MNAPIAQNECIGYLFVLIHIKEGKKVASMFLIKC